MYAQRVVNDIDVCIYIVLTSNGTLLLNSFNCCNGSEHSVTIFKNNIVKYEGLQIEAAA